MTDKMGRQIVLAARPQGSVRLTDLQVKNSPIPTIPAGGLLLEVNYLSLDPYMRGRMDDRKSYAEPTKVGDVMTGETINTVVGSNHPDFATGEMVLAYAGWRTHAAIQPPAIQSLNVRKIAPGTLPVTTQLGVLGMPGFTAYAGLKEIGKPKKGETVVVAAAAGPVGSLVGQLARLDGARAVGIAGGAEKCRYVKEELRFDAVVDHRLPDFEKALQAACPDGIDVYYENVGGTVWHAVLPLLNRFARVPVSGIIAYYDSQADRQGPDLLPETMRLVISQRLFIQGFINFDYKQKLYSKFQSEVSKGITDGQIKYREDIVDGLENAPAALAEAHIIRVMAVDDHPLMMAGIAGEINAQPDMRVVAEASDGDEALTLFRKHHPDVTLMDIRMPKVNGIAAITAIRQEFPRARIVVLTTAAGDIQVVRAFKAGAVGYLLKNLLRTELVETIRLIHSGRKRVPPEVAQQIAEHAADDSITDRELDVLRGVAQGNSNKIIASDLNISEHTVKNHLKSILSKLDASDRTHAVMIALKRGFLDM